MSIAIEDTKAGAEEMVGELRDVDLADLDAMFARIPSGPYSADARGEGWEVRAIDTDPTNRHHWPYRLCESIRGQKAGCDPDVFGFIAGVINAWPLIRAAIARAESAEAELARLQALPPLHEQIVPAQGDEVACPAAADVLAERRRQIKTEGWSPEHNDQHQRQELSLAAACYALGTTTPYGKTLWPWHYSAWKPRNYRTNLIKAGALILAEIERLDRAANKGDA